MCAGFVISLLIPMVLQNMTLFRKLTWVYVIVGVGALGVVAIAGQTSYGGQTVPVDRPLTIQPSEFVKKLFLSCLLHPCCTSARIFIRSW